MSRPSVIIVGAGAAGLSAAEALSAAGRPVILLEAADRIGGRILTVRDASSSTPIELGGEFIHGTPRATWRIVRAAGLAAYDVPFEHLERRGRGWIGPPHYADNLQKAMAGLSHLGRKDISFADYLRNGGRGQRMASEKLAALDFVEGFDAADPERISAKSLAEEQQNVGDVAEQMQFRLVEGYGKMLEHMRAAWDSRKVQVLLKRKVTEIQWRRGQVQIRCEGFRNPFAAERVLLTLPLGILQLHPGAEGAVRFLPDIPDKRAAARLLDPGAVIKVVLVFRDPFWERRRPKGGIDMAKAVFIHDPDLPFPTWWTMRPLHVPLLTGWVGGPRATTMSTLSADGIKEQALRSLGRMFHLSRRELAAMLVSSHCHNWQADPLARGAYSYVTVGGGRGRRELAKPVDDTIFFAGEATDHFGEASTVAGALASGGRAAKEILAVLR